MPTGTALSAETLGQIALIQGMVAHLPDRTSILQFVCRGLAIVPGVDRVSYRIFDPIIADTESGMTGERRNGRFPLIFRSHVYGDLSFGVSDPSRFAPYIPYLENLSHMLAVIFEERRQRRLNDVHKEELERRVLERTKLLETEIREHERSQKLLNSIINNTRNVIYVKDLEGRFTLVNDRFCEIFELHREQVINHLPSDLFPDHVARQHSDNDRLIVRKRHPVTFEESAALPDGPHDYISIKFPIFDDNEAVAAVGGISTDITDLKAAENALRLDEARLEALLTLFQMTDASMKDVTRYALEEAIRLTKSKIGYLAFTNAEESLLTMHAWSEAAMAQCSIEEPQTSFVVADIGLMGEAVRQRKPVVTNDYAAPNAMKKGYPDGHIPLLRHMNVPVYDGAHIVAVAGVGNKETDYDEADVRQLRLLMQGMWRLVQWMKADDENKELERRLRQAHKMESIGTLAGGIAHDFNNILSAIFGYTELSMAETTPGSLLHGSLRNVLKAAKRARDLVSHILAFSRQGEQETMAVEITPIVKEVLKFMRASLPASIDIRQQIKDAPMVLADPTQIHQVVMNLCTNAGQAMQSDGGVLEVRLETLELDAEFVGRYPELAAGAHVKLTVSDTGEGIPEELLERIFEPFFTTKERGEGTGMGLSVVHGIVKNHGGAITVYSSPGNGAVFNVFLPAIERRSIEGGRRENNPIGGTERILLVDDEATLVELGMAMLGALGYDVVGVQSSTDALATFSENADRFDLVITDLTMPRMTGDQLAQALLQIRPTIPIILCTGFSASIDEQRARAMGIRAFVNKPILGHQIAKTIRQVLDKRSD